MNGDSIYTVGEDGRLQKRGQGDDPHSSFNCNLACAREARKLCFSGGLFLVPTNPAHHSGTPPFDAPT